MVAPFTTPTAAYVESALRARLARGDTPSHLIRWTNDAEYLALVSERAETDDAAALREEARLVRLAVFSHLGGAEEKGHA